MKITSMQKMIGTVLAFVVIAILVAVFVILPQFGELDTLSQERIQAQGQVQQAQAVLAQLEESKSRSAATEADILKIGTQMPDSPQLPTLIIEMQDIADKAGVSVTSFAPAQPAAGTSGQYTEITMSTALTAGWDDLLDYLRRLNSATRLLRTTNITITPPASTTGTATASSEPLLTVSLTIKAYVIGTNGVLSSTPTGTAAPTATPAP
jgi:type IV pilus assembly protein PilO